VLPLRKPEPPMVFASASEIEELLIDSDPEVVFPRVRCPKRAVRG
jgi:hypothetical protein